MKKIAIILTLTLIYLLSAQNIFAQGKDKDAADKGQAVKENKEKDRAQDEERMKKAQQSRDELLRIGTMKRADSNETAKGRPSGKAQKELKQGKDKSEQPEQALPRAHQMQLRAIEDQLNHEQVKYMERQARLDRIMQLAKEKNNPQVVKQVEELQQKEKERYEKTTQRLHSRRQRTLERGQRPDREEYTRERVMQAERERIEAVEREKAQQDPNNITAED
ncbi:MAG: hypothetical protein WCZ89_10500 [Phycisphaerae bacterium]